MRKIVLFVCALFLVVYFICFGLAFGYKFALFLQFIFIAIMCAIAIGIVFSIWILFHLFKEILNFYNKISISYM